LTSHNGCLPLSERQWLGRAPAAIYPREDFIPSRQLMMMAPGEQL
jgi:hypothetical protein